MLGYSIIILMCSISCNYLMIGLRRVDGSLVGGVTEINETWVVGPRDTVDVTSTFANDAVVRTRDTDSSFEMRSRSGTGRRSSIE